MKNDNVKLTVLGIDLAKQSFQLHGVDKTGNVLMKKKVSRSKLIETLTKLSPCLIGMEACGGAHYWAKYFQKMGHTVRLMAPQFVKPYVKSNKNDQADAEAICEAVQRPSMRFVPIKSNAQQDMQSMHRIRSQLVSRKTAQSNQIRGLLMEYGIVIAKGSSHVVQRLPDILEDADNGLSDLFRELLEQLQQELIHLSERIAQLEKKLAHIADNTTACRRLQTIPGIGLLSATALVAAVGDVSAFKSGREMAAWLGLVPRQHSTGGKPTLLGISKRGDNYLRALLIHGGRSIVRCSEKHNDKRNQWLTELKQRRGNNIAAVAAANKNARIAWAVLTQHSRYQRDYGMMSV